MLLHHFLSEDAHADLAAFQRANAILHALIRHLRRASPEDHYGFRALRFADGKVMLCLQGKDIGLSGEDARLWLRFAPMQGYAATGGFSRFARSDDPVITIFGLEGSVLDVDAARNIIISRQPVHTVLIHELTHYVDGHRNPTILANGTSEEKQGGARYYNDPVEFNGYFTNFAEPLLRFLHAAKSPNAERASLIRMADATGIDANFKTTLQNLITRAAGLAHPAVAKYWRRLKKDRRHRLIARLYNLHQQVRPYLPAVKSSG